jgi:hypothetical protein
VSRVLDRIGRRTVIGLWLGATALTALLIALRLSGIVSGAYPDLVALPAWSITFSTFGAVVAIRRPGNRVGLLLLAIGCAEAVVVALGQTAYDLLDNPVLAGSFGLASEAVRLAAFFGLALVLFIFPTGSFLSRRWRIPAGVVAVGLIAAFVGDLIIPSAITDQLWKSPIHVRNAPVDTIVTAIASVGYAGIVAAVVSLGVRYRRSPTEVRRQIKLFVIAATAVVIFIAAMTLLFPKQMNGTLGEIVWTTPPIVLTSAATLAVMRYGLYEIDRVISRTLAYAIVTIILGGTFALVVLVPTALLGSGTKAPGWLVAFATLAVFGLFRPVLRRVRTIVDRRFNRSRYDAARTIEAFSARLRDEIDLTTLREELTDIVGQTMQPAHVSLWVRDTTR